MAFGPRNLIEAAHQDAYEILFNNRDVLDTLVTELLEKETLDKEQVARIFEPMRKRPSRPAWTGSARRQPSDIGPVEVPLRHVGPNGSTPGGSSASSGADGTEQPTS